MRSKKNIFFLIRLFYSCALISISLMLTNCTSTGALKEYRANLEKLGPQKVFIAPYPSVWRACQISVKYPVAVNNMDMGVIETDWIRSLDGFSPPHSESKSSAGMRYKITIQLVKGKVDKKESTKITILKKIEIQKDFFSEPEQIASDGLEEKAFLYRVERELFIEEALKKVRTTN